MTAPAEPVLALPLDPNAAAERVRQTAAEAAAALAHMDAAVTAAEAELAIARYRHVHRLAHLPAAD